MRKALLSASFFTFFSAAALAQQPVKLTTLDWCPFTCAGDADGGFTSYIAREAFRTVGVTVEIEFVPWLRAIEKARESQEIVGYFPAYLEGVRPEFVASPSIGSSRVGLAMLNDRPAPAGTVEALKSLKIGAVTGYKNSKTVAEAVRAGLKLDEANDDLTNIKKLAAGRIDAAEIDEFVLGHMLRTDPRLADVRGSVAFKLTLEEIPLVVAFNKTAAGQKNLSLFTQGLAKLNISELQKAYSAARQ